MIKAGSGSISGEGVNGGRVFATLSGAVSGDSVRIVTTYTSFDPGYVATFTGTISPDGSTMSGSWESNQNQSGTWTATRAGGSPGPPPASANAAVPGQTDESVCDPSDCSDLSGDFGLSPNPADDSLNVTCDADTSCEASAEYELPPGTVAALEAYDGLPALDEASSSIGQALGMLSNPANINALNQDLGLDKAQAQSFDATILDAADEFGGAVGGPAVAQDVAVDDQKVAGLSDAQNAFLKAQVEAGIPGGNLPQSVADRSALAATFGLSPAEAQAAEDAVVGAGPAEPALAQDVAVDDQKVAGLSDAQNAFLKAQVEAGIPGGNLPQSVADRSALAATFGLSPAEAQAAEDAVVGAGPAEPALAQDVAVDDQKVAGLSDAQNAFLKAQVEAGIPGGNLPQSVADRSALAATFGLSPAEAQAAEDAVVGAGPAEPALAQDVAVDDQKVAGLSDAQNAFLKAQVEAGIPGGNLPQSVADRSALAATFGLSPAEAQAAEDAVVGAGPAEPALAQDVAVDDQKVAGLSDAQNAFLKAQVEAGIPGGNLPQSVADRSALAATFGLSPAEAQAAEDAVVGAGPVESAAASSTNVPAAENALNTEGVVLNTMSASGVGAQSGNAVGAAAGALENVSPDISSSVSTASDLAYITGQEPGRVLASATTPKSALPKASLVVDAVYAADPSAAALKAFNTTLALAKETRPSLLRGGARFILAFAFAIGRRVLEPELSVKGVTSLGTVRARIPAKAKRELRITTTRLQARISRLVDIFALSHPVKLGLQISSTQSGNTISQAKTFAVP